MYRSNPHIASAVALALTVACSTVNAQVKIQMTTAPTPTIPATNCTVTTDASGLQLVPGTTDLKANGVTLNPAGCGGGTAGTPDNFAAAITVPASTSLNTPFTVTWSASADASMCVFGGAPTANVSGWSFGTAACNSSTQCAGSHPVQVTVSAAGSYNFNVTCTNASGYAQGSIAAANNTPPTPADFPLTATPSPATVNQPFKVTWNVQNATRCDGTVVSGPGTLPGWTTPTDASGTRANIVAATAGAYVLKLECSNTYGSVTSQQTTVNVGTTPTSCPGPAGMTRLTTSNISYGQPIGAGDPTRSNVNVTEWSNIWGFTSPSGTTPVSWPGVRGASAVIRGFGRDKFVAAHFNTGSSPTTLNGYFVYGALAQPNLDMRISTVCGDFSPNTENAACLADGPNHTGIAGDGNASMHWDRLTTNSTYCHLTPNTDYYLNIKVHDPVNTNNCGGTTCPIWLTSYPNRSGQ
ncbi:hypothetical protein [Dokdonella sp.]|uniref:hypothetical protein n=1 Tax=Dokdonella sp. TaxID=2291710 RepID=UPI001B012A80|nr:hypothetical protein [Dokdonella sp.]MBO9665105.1 hypothetical protein [Dokdonella sp.]